MSTRQEGETARRLAYLKEETNEEDPDDILIASPFFKDRYGLDLDEFKEKTGKAPKNWQMTLRQTKVIVIDEMRTLLELHYDDVHLQNWHAKYANSQKICQIVKGHIRSSQASHRHTGGS